jgi:transcriptional regulator with XRE-family HTH domain
MNDIIAQISNLLTISSKTDSEIGIETGVSREMVYKWRTKKVKSIRTSNLRKLAEVLDYKLEIDLDGSMSLEPLTIEDEMMSGKNNAEVLVKTIDNLWLQLETKDNSIRRLEQIIKEREEIIKDLDKTINNLSKPLNLNLDINRMQFIVNMEDQNYVNCTQLYADLFALDAFDIIKNKTWADLVHDDDLWRFGIILQETPKQQEMARTWKVRGNGEYLYVETSTLPLDDKGILKKVDVKISNKDKWRKDNEYYKSYPSATD